MSRFIFVSMVLVAFLCLSAAEAAPAKPPLVGFTADQKVIDQLVSLGVERIVFSQRNKGMDVAGHYYANFGYSSIRPEHWLYPRGGSKLVMLDLKSRTVKTLIDVADGTVRDPKVHYDGKKIILSYRKSGSNYFHLYEMELGDDIPANPKGGEDSSQKLTQLTFGPWDDIEPTYLPDGGIAFCSSRCKRYIGCWIASSAILFRCDGDGKNIRMLSSGAFTENTPIVHPDGRIIYTRWEYVNRGPVLYHHLWSMNPDGTNPMAFFGNMRPEGVFIDARPIPGTNDFVFCHSPRHGRNDHVGSIETVTPTNGPNDRSTVKTINGQPLFRDPFPLGKEFFLVAGAMKHGRKYLHLMHGDPRSGLSGPVFGLDSKDNGEIHEPVVVRPRPRERVVPSKVDMLKTTGTVVLTRAHFGRNMGGMKAGTVKKLLIMEQLPKPVNVHGGGSQPIAHGVASTLHRILGTVPVEPDGSAHFTVPAMRSVYFALLDENDLCIKQMRSFTTIQPGEQITCIGCHEERDSAPLDMSTAPIIQALKRGPSRIARIEDVPDVIDFPRDIQPILDRHCVECHNPDKRDGGVDLCGDYGPVYSAAYYHLYLFWQIKDTQGHPAHGSGNKQLGNDPPWVTYSYASELMKKLDGSHYKADLSQKEQRTLRLWIDSGAVYAGTYGCYGSGQIGDVWVSNVPTHEMADGWPSTRGAVDAVRRRCGGCHAPEGFPYHITGRTRISGWSDFLSWTRPLSRYSRHRIYNLSRPEKSMILTAPLAKSAGGQATEPLAEPKRIVEDRSRPPLAIKHPVVFQSTDDADYQAILTHVEAGKTRLETIKRFDRPDFRPGKEYIREMCRYGLLKEEEVQNPEEPINTYEADRRYWEMMYPENWQGKMHP